MANRFCDRLYLFISEHLQNTGTSPSFSEMTKALSISPRSKSLITRSLRTLEKERKLVLQKEGRRLLIKLLSKELPLLGHLSANNLIKTISDTQLLDMNDLFKADDRFALLVNDASLKDEGLFNGDMIICQKSETAKEGDTVIALIDQRHATLKRISYKIEGMITLIPASSELKPRAYIPERIRIKGVYLGLVRTNKLNLT